MRQTPRVSQRRPEVVTRARRQAGRPIARRRLRQLDVLHQRLVGEAAEALEDRAADEDGLVAGGHAGPARAQRS